MSEDYRNQIDRTRRERAAAEGEPRTTESAHAPGKFVRPSLWTNGLLIILLIAAAAAWLVFR